ATVNGVELTPSRKDQLSDFVVSMALSGRAVVTRARAVRKVIRVSRSMGSAALALAYVANGRFDAMVQQGGLSTWDVAAAGLIAERAGAVVTTFEGSTWYDQTRVTRTLSIVAAPAGHHARLLALANGSPG